jgi:hypothetical protein
MRLVLPKEQREGVVLPRGRGAVLPGLPGPVPHHLRVNGAGDAVV